MDAPLLNIHSTASITRAALFLRNASPRKKLLRTIIFFPKAKGTVLVSHFCLVGSLLYPESPQYQEHQGYPDTPNTHTSYRTQSYHNGRIPLLYNFLPFMRKNPEKADKKSGGRGIISAPMHSRDLLGFVPIREFPAGVPPQVSATNVKLCLSDT